MATTILNLPVQYVRQQALPIDVDTVFSTTAARITYLGNPRAYAGQIVADTQAGGAYMINAGLTAWLPVAPAGAADDGLTLSSGTVILGGTTLTDKEIDLSVNNNVMWFKESLAPTAYSQFIVGQTNTSGATGTVWGFPHPAILISKNIAADGNNSVFMEMSNSDAASLSQYNGFLFLNYQNVDGEVQPNIRCASNAAAGQGGAYNLDLAGRDSYNQSGNNYSHFSIWYYDYDQYFYSDPGAPGPMLNSDFVNFNNGQGGGSGATRFFMIDKHYNTLLGKAAWNASPAATLDIQDNSSSYPGIYQRGATSGNWFAGTTIVGGTLPSSFSGTYQLTVTGSLQVTGVIDLRYLTTPDTDGAGAGMISANGAPFIHLGANDSQDTYSVYIGIQAGATARVSPADVQSAVAIGFGALQSYGGSQQFDGAVVGTGCGQALTSGQGVVLVGWATCNSGTSISSATIVGSMAGCAVNGNFNTLIGAGAAGPNDSYVSLVGTASATECTIVGAFSAAALSGVTLDEIIILGYASNKVTNSGTWTNTTLIGNGITTNLNNVLVLGTATQDVILGITSPSTDTGYRLQVTGNANTGSTADGIASFVATWNTTGNTTAVLANITNTASGSGSKLLDLQVGGTSEFSIAINGELTLSATQLAAASSNTVDHKIAVNVGGTTYYILVSTSAS